jgi:hypothetical protein
MPYYTLPSSAPHMSAPTTSRAEVSREYRRYHFVCTDFVSYGIPVLREAKWTYAILACVYDDSC